MPAFMNFDPPIKGEATDEGHKEWILIESMSSPIHRSNPAGGGVDSKRTRGETTIGDISCVRTLDKSSTKLQEACANGTFYKSVEIHFCVQVNNKAEPYLKYLLKDVILTSYSIHATASGSPLPTEEVSMAPTELEWTYVVVNSKTGKPEGNVPAKYNPGKGKA